MPSSNYGRELWLRALFGDDHGPNIPDPFYLALVKSVPGDLDDGTDLDEPSGAEYPSYARAAVANDDTQWDYLIDSTPPLGHVRVYNLDDITFPSAAASAGATVVAVVITDDPTGGEIIVWTLLGASMVVGEASVTPRFEPSTLFYTLQDPPTSLPSGG